VLLVVIAHVNFPLLKLGGITGVTLFFVLSGYLITSLLLKERAGTGAIHLRHFYIRRALRLLPALVAAMLTVGVVAIVLGMDVRSVTLAGFGGPLLLHQLPARFRVRGRAVRGGVVAGDRGAVLPDVADLPHLLCAAPAGPAVGGGRDLGRRQPRPPLPRTHRHARRVLHVLLVAAYQRLVAPVRRRPGHPPLRRAPAACACRTGHRRRCGDPAPGVVARLAERCPQRSHTCHARAPAGDRCRSRCVRRRPRRGRRPQPVSQRVERTSWEVSSTPRASAVC
jgi:hypothetical protein